MKKIVLKNEVLKRYFDTMLDHRKSNSRQAAYLELVKMAKKRVIHRSELKRLLLLQLNKKNYTTNILYLSIRFADLQPHLYMTDDEKVMKYLKGEDSKVNPYQVRYLVKLYLFRWMPSDGIRHLISTFII